MCKNFPRRLGTEAARNDLVLCQRAWAPVLSAPLLWTTRRLKWDFRHSRVVLKNEPSESPSSAHGVPRPRRPGKEYGTEETTREGEAGTAHLVTRCGGHAKRRRGVWDLALHGAVRKHQQQAWHIPLQLHLNHSLSRSRLAGIFRCCCPRHFQ